VGRRAFGVPGSHGEEPVLGTIEELVVIEDAAGDRQVANGVDDFLAKDVVRTPDVRDPNIPGIGRQLFDDLAIQPGHHRFFIKRRPAAMLRVLLDLLRKRLELFGAEPESWTGEIDVIKAPGPCGQNRAGQAFSKLEASNRRPG